MHVSLTPELESLVKGQVESGLYNSSSEVVREALRLWNEQQQYKKKMELLRAKLELAEKSPLLDEFSMSDLIKELDDENNYDYLLLKEHLRIQMLTCSNIAID